MTTTRPASEEDTQAENIDNDPKSFRDDFDDETGEGTDPQDDPSRPKRLRVNHNEIERKRRNAQKERLNDLRRAIPALANQERAPMVAIIVRAKEYIDQLRNRIFELESFLASGSMRVPTVLQLPGQAFSSPQQSLGSVQSSALASPRPSSSFQPIAPMPRPMPSPMMPMSPAAVGSAPPHLFQNQLQLQHQMMNQAMLLAEAASRLPVLQPQPSPMHPAPGPQSPSTMVQGSEPKTGTMQSPKKSPVRSDSLFKKNSSSGSDIELQTLLQHRKSSLILPTDDNVYFGKRDSIQNFLNSGLSNILEESLQSDIKCIKCARGINNLIMIDCDNCHSWYHIRCVGMESSNIPLTWKCPECS